MKKLKYVLIAICLLPVSALAHVKWFAQPGESVPSYKLSDGPVLAWIGISIVLVLFGVFLEKKLKVPEKLSMKLSKWGPVALSLTSIGLGLSLLIFSLKGFIFAPNLPVESTFGLLLLILQVVSGVMILFGFYERVGALLLLILFALGFFEFGAKEMIDTLEMVGFALFALIIGRPKWKITEAKWIEKFTSNLEEYGVPLLRVGTGLNLLILGFSEKILSPSLSQNFLAHYQWNFMQALGFEHFTNYWFAFSAGVMEALIGVFLILGLITRTTTIFLAGFLITTLMLLGPIELIGHLPHFSIAIVLLVLGSGKRLKIL